MMDNTQSKPADQFWNDSARKLIAVTAQKLNLRPDIAGQRQALLVAIQRDDLFPDKTEEKKTIIAAQGSWSMSGSFEEMYPFHGALVRSAIVATAVQTLTNHGSNTDRQRMLYDRH